MATLRPAYLQHIEVRRRRSDPKDHTHVVVLLPAGRPCLPQHLQDQLTHLPHDHELHLGFVLPHPPGPANGHHRTATITAWAFTRGHTGRRGPQHYRTRYEAAESCAIDIIDGPAARQRFDLDRWDHRRPTDN